jgi:hypothetical protein
MCGEGVRVDIIDRSSGPEKMKPTCEKHIKKLQRLLADQAQSVAALALAKFSLDGVALPLVIEELPLLLGHQIWITFGPAKSRTTQPDPMTQTERTLTACPINLIGANNGRLMTITPAIGQHLSL